MRDDLLASELAFDVTWHPFPPGLPPITGLRALMPTRPRELPRPDAVHGRPADLQAEPYRLAEDRRRRRVRRCVPGWRDAALQGPETRGRRMMTAASGRLVRGEPRDCPAERLGGGSGPRRPEPSRETEKARIGRHVKSAVTETADQLQARLRVDTTAALGPRVANAWRREVYPPGRPSVRSPDSVYTKAPDIIDAFNKGVPIRGKTGNWLAIPLEAAGTGPRGKHMTPALFEQTRGLKLLVRLSARQEPGAAGRGQCPHQRPWAGADQHRLARRRPLHASGRPYHDPGLPSCPRSAPASGSTSIGAPRKRRTTQVRLQARIGDP